MSRRPDPVRIQAARRAATIARLISAGELPDRATAWVARWEASLEGPASRADWEAVDASRSVGPGESPSPGDGVRAAGSQVERTKAGP
jgi:hypothetical protein